MENRPNPRDRNWKDMVVVFCFYLCLLQGVSTTEEVLRQIDFPLDVVFNEDGPNRREEIGLYSHPVRGGLG